VGAGGTEPETGVAWLKALHIASLLAWCAGLLYLPGLFAASRGADMARLRRVHMAMRFTFVAVTSPAAIVAILSGAALAAVTAAQGGWLLAKLGAVTAMVVFHLYCGHLVTLLDTSPRLGRRPRSSWLAGVPAALMAAVFWLALAKPF